VGEKASERISPKTAGSWPALMATYVRPAPTYSTIMAGTSLSATAAIRRMPPRRTRPTAAVIISPGTHVGTVTPKITRAASTNVRATVFDCAMLPVPRSAAAAPKNANMYARLMPTGPPTPREM
jgi:hypothetical protein